MKLAFLLSPYTDASHLKRLVDSLPGESVFFVHVDKKSDIRPFEEALAGDTRVRFLAKRANVAWGSIRQVEYQMELIRAALAAEEAFDYFVTMSGMDYPVWSNRRILDHLEQHRGRQFLQAICMKGQGKSAEIYTIYRPFASHPWAKGSAGSKLRAALRKTIAWMGIRKPIEFDADGRHYTLYKGSDWHAITPELARYVLEKWDHIPALRRYFKNSFTPSETLIHTLAFNSSFAKDCMLVEGKYESLAALTPLTYIDYHPDIKVLSEEDFPRIVSSGKMFCRKVISGKSDKLVKMLDRHRALEEENITPNGIRRPGNS
ncbi:MAG: conjugal transfer protein [Prevotella sp.]|nr:conjugal transfer protein [Prevotella sp.]